MPQHMPLRLIVSTQGCLQDASFSWRRDFDQLQARDVLKVFSVESQESEPALNGLRAKPKILDAKTRSPTGAGQACGKLFEHLPGQPRRIFQPGCRLCPRMTAYHRK